MSNAHVASYTSVKLQMEEFLITTDEDFNITGITDFLASCTGKDKLQLLGTHISELLTSDSDSSHNIIPASFSSAGNSFYVHALMPQLNGKSVPTHWIVTRINNGNHPGESGLTWIGCKVKAGETNNERLPDQFNLIENVSDAIIALDMNMTIVTWNKAAEDIYGYKAEEVKGKLLSDAVQFEYTNESREAAREILFQAGRWQGEVSYTKKDGTTFYLFSSVSLMKDKEGNNYGIVAVNRDITGRKEAEAEAIKKEKLLSAVAVVSNELLARQDHFQVIEESLAAIAHAAEAERSTLFQYLYDEDKHVHYMSMKLEWIDDTCKEGGNTELSYVSSSKITELVSTFQKGEVFTRLTSEIKDPWFHQNLLNYEVQSFMAIPIFTDGKFWGVITWQQCTYPRIWKKAEIGILKSFVITLSAAIERNSAYRKLQDSEEKLKALFQNSLDIVFVIDEELSIKYVAPAIEKVLGYVDTALINTNWLDLVHEQDVKKIRRELKHLVADEHANLLINLRVLNHASEWVWMELKGQNQLSNLHIHGLVLSVRDISERHNAQQILTAYSETISAT